MQNKILNIHYASKKEQIIEFDRGVLDGCALTIEMLFEVRHG